MLSTFIKLPFVNKIFALSIFEWPLKTGLYCIIIFSFIHDSIGLISLRFCLSSRMSNKYPMLDWNDTFLNMDHLRNSFPDYDIEVTSDDVEKHKPPFK